MAENTTQVSENTIATKTNFTDAKKAVSDYKLTCSACIEKIREAVGALKKAGAFQGEAAAAFYAFFDKVTPILENVSGDKSNSLCSGLENYLTSIERVLFDNTDTQLGEENKTIAGITDVADSTGVGSELDGN